MVTYDETIGETRILRENFGSYETMARKPPIGGCVRLARATFEAPRLGRLMRLRGVPWLRAGAHAPLSADASQRVDRARARRSTSAAVAGSGASMFTAKALPADVTLAVTPFSTRGQ
jgi:hypothetical protein